MKKRIILSISVVILLIVLLVTNQPINASETKEIKLRFISTSDLHGRLTTKNYEDGVTYTGSLSRAYTAIEEARNEKGKENTFTFDIGDVLYDYTTEYIYEHDEEAIQPIYKAMAKYMDYDAITLGNHEFDYGKDYILNQIKGAGLQDICVVSNLTDSKTGQPIFKKNMMLKRKAKASDGSEVSVQIGVIGETIPNLSKKRYNYTGVFATEDIVENVKTQATLLKKQGADVIVVIAHAGIGVEEPVKNAESVTYALTKIPEVDVVLGGHAHKRFPSNDLNVASFYELPNVDKSTGLVNGKSLIMTNDRATSIGVADLTLEVSGEQKTITQRSSELRKIDKSVLANQEIEDSFGDWAIKLQEALEKIVGKVQTGEEIQNYFGLVEDSNAIQLLNNSKINYALQYINSSEGAQYKNYPVIAASHYMKYGENSASDYVNFTGQISEPKLAALMPYNKYLYLYRINGAQLKEWLEWSASAYETAYKPKEWSDEEMRTIQRESGLNSLLAEEWIDNWSPFYIFDGIEYVIDPSIEPRYDFNGKQINDTNRITDLTYNGEPIEDTTMFVLASDSISKGTPVYGKLNKSVIKKGLNKAFVVLANYIRELGKVGDLIPEKDNNWRIRMPADQGFIVKTSRDSAELAKKASWYQNIINTIDQFTYFKGKFSNTVSDTTGPNIVLASTNKNPTNQTIKIVVHATDVSGIKEIKYAEGDHNVGENMWTNAAVVKDGFFEVPSSGLYSVYVVDNKGNESVEKIKVDNIGVGIVPQPIIKSFSNRAVNITGTAEPGMKIFFETVDDRYESVVKEDGTFAYALPPQWADNRIYVYIEDGDGNRSERTEVVVKRTGANMPITEPITNIETELKGKTNDELVTVYVKSGKKVYVAKNGGKNKYLKCNKYDKSLKIVETSLEINSNGEFTMKLPAQNGGRKLKVYSIDHVGRVSRVENRVVEEVAPNIPTIYPVTNFENIIYGQVTSSQLNKSYHVNIKIGNQSYETETDEYGYYSYVLSGSALKTREKIEVYASDTIEDKIRQSATASYEVKDINELLPKEGKEVIVFENISEKTLDLQGKTGKRDQMLSIYILDENGERTVYHEETDHDGDFSLELSELLPLETTIYGILRERTGALLGVGFTKVVQDIPDVPVLQSDEINNMMDSVLVGAGEGCSVTVQIGDAIYSSEEGDYDETQALYIHEISIEKPKAGDIVKIYGINEMGESKKLSLEVIERVPEAPEVGRITTESEEIIGNIHIVGTDDSIQPTVENTQTKIYAKIGKEVYEGKIKENGSFSILIPKHKKERDVIVWGENLAGKGLEKITKIVKVVK